MSSPAVVAVPVEAKPEVSYLRYFAIGFIVLIILIVLWYLSTLFFTDDEEDECKDGWNLFSAIEQIIKKQRKNLKQ